MKCLHHEGSDLMCGLIHCEPNGTLEGVGTCGNWDLVKMIVLLGHALGKCILSIVPSPSFLSTHFLSLYVCVYPGSHVIRSFPFFCDVSAFEPADLGLKPLKL